MTFNILQMSKILYCVFDVSQHWNIGYNEFCCVKRWDGKPHGSFIWESCIHFRSLIKGQISPSPNLATSRAQQYERSWKDHGQVRKLFYLYDEFLNGLQNLVLTNSTSAKLETLKLQSFRHAVAVCLRSRKECFLFLRSTNLTQYYQKERKVRSKAIIINTHTKMRHIIWNDTL